MVIVEGAYRDGTLVNEIADCLEREKAKEYFLTVLYSTPSRATVLVTITEVTTKSWLLFGGGE